MLKNHFFVKRSPATPYFGLLVRRRQIVERFRHAAVFIFQNLLHVLGGFGCGPVIRPIPHAFGDLESLRVAGELVLIDHAGEDLVDGVKRSPGQTAAGGIARGIGVAWFAGEFIQPVEKLHGERAKVAAAEFFLHLGKFGNHVIALSLRIGVAAGGQLRERGKSMAGEVPAQLSGARSVVRVLPTRNARRAHIGQGLGALSIEAGVFTEVVE